MARHGTLAHALLLAALLLCFCACSKGGKEFAATASPMSDALPAVTPEPIVFSAATAAPAGTVSSDSTPDAATPTPAEPVRVTLGAVGDILAMRVQIAAAYDEATGEYDFSQSFYGMESLFKSVDVMCANLETPLAGEEARYAQKSGSGERPTFNAPDALAENLRDLGVDVLTTANNHCLDRGLDGLRRTIETLDAAGIANTGAYCSADDRATPCIVSVKGMRIGIIAASYGVNTKRALPDETRACLSLLSDSAQLAADIAACRAAGAEFIVCFPHWDQELTNNTSASTRKTARWLLENGVDCILGSHPHVVQGAEWITVTRDGGEYTGFVAYSLGNCIGNMTQEGTAYGLFVTLTLQKGADGQVALERVDYQPTLCFATKAADGVRTLHQVVPAFEDAACDARVIHLPENFAARIAKAREYIENIWQGRA